MGGWLHLLSKNVSGIETRTADAGLATWCRFVFIRGSLMRISDFIARVVTQRRGLVWCGVAALATVCIAILVTRIRLDSDVLNILPAKFTSIAGLKIYDRDFEQTRELTFALLCDP
ncbi:MAG: hypothetical protein DMF46_02265, partial [Verrucomicrobia bacterium]